MSFRRFAPVVASVAVFLAAFLTTARAGLQGQPRPSLEISAKIRAEGADILKGNIATGRPNLFLIVQTNAATDFTDLVTRVVGDDTTYTGLTDTLDEAFGAEKDGKNQQFILYNLARINLLRANFLHSTAARRPPLMAAADAAGRFDKDLRDPIAWELKGDIDSELEDVPGAIAAYKQLAACGASAAEVRFKYGWAYEKARRMPDAETQYKAAQTAQAMSNAGGPRLRHKIYQGLARVEFSQGNERQALASLAQSARVEQDADSPFHFELTAANELLNHGYATEVTVFAQAALRVAPDDDEARDLLERARAVKVRGR